MGKRPRAVRLAVPATFVAILTLVALWRVSAPVVPASGKSASPEPLAALTQIADRRPESIRWPCASIVSVTGIR